jgi:SAM-dependent methyltransferase
MRFVIVGSGRCGTRLLWEMLNMHPDLLVVNESHFLVDFRNRYGVREVETTELVRRVMELRHANGSSIIGVNLECFGITPSEMAEFFARLEEDRPQLSVSQFYDCVATFWMKRCGKRLWADKTPDYGCFLSEIREMWPGVKVIHIRRDGFSVARSMMNHVGYQALLSVNSDWWGTVAALTMDWEARLAGRSFSGAEMLELWARRQLRIAQDLRGIPRDEWVEVQYEDLVRNPVGVLERLAKFSGLSVLPEWTTAAACCVDGRLAGRDAPCAHDLGVSADLREAPTARLLLASKPRQRRIVGLAMVKNEGDIIEPFVRHNLQFLDCLCILDNGSTDRTRETLVALQREGLPVVVLDDPSPAYFQAEKMTRLLKAVCSSFFPDFAIPLDADEFIRCESVARFRVVLEAVPSGGCGLVPWSTYIIRPEECETTGGDHPRSMSWRRARENPQYFKALLRLDGAYVPELFFTQGNHAVQRTDGRVVVSVFLESIALAHFPVRSADQMAAKAVVGWMAYLLRNPMARSEDLGYQWREVFDFVANSGEVRRDHLALMSMRYAQSEANVDWDKDVVRDPVAFCYERKFSGPGCGALSLVARAIEGALAEKSLPFEDEVRKACQQKISQAEQDDLGERVSETVFDARWHYDHLFLDLPPVRFLMDVFQPRSVLDVGCGVGAYLAYFKYRGVVDCMGIDGIKPEATILPKSFYFQHDLSVPFNLGRQFDLVMCVEVVEHMELAEAREMIQSLATHARDRILFSAAEPGQPGHGHISCRPLEEWLRDWSALGWEPDVQASLSVRCLSTFYWLRRNPVILVRVGSTPNLSGRGVLTDIACRTFRWHAQSPEIVSHPLSQDFPPDLFEATGG